MWNRNGNRSSDSTNNWSVLHIRNLAKRQWFQALELLPSFPFFLLYNFLSLCIGRFVTFSEFFFHLYNFLSRWRAAGGLVSNDFGDSVFLLTLGMVVAVLEFKGFYIFFKQNEILTLLNDTCIQFVPNNEQLLHSVNKTLNIFKKCCVIFIVLSIGLTLIIMILSSPLISQKLPFDIWFPLDYKRSRTAHWMAHCFVFINELFVILVSLLSSILWYVMLNCSIKYEILGYRLKNCGAPVGLDNQIITEAKNHDFVESELIKCIQMHQMLEKYGINQITEMSVCGAKFNFAHQEGWIRWHVFLTVVFHTNWD